MLETILQRAAERFPDNIAIAFGGVELTYREIEEGAARVASALEGRVRPGDRVACFLHNGPELIEIMHACFRLGASVVFISPLFKAKEASTILRLCTPRALFTEHDIYESVIAPVAPTLPPIDLCCLRAPRTSPPVGTCSLADLKRSATMRRHAPVTLPEAREACVFFTSGSTGNSKGVSHGSRELMITTSDAVRHFELSSEDRILFCEPISGNTFPLTLAVLPAALAGARLTLLPSDASYTSYEPTFERAVSALVHEQITCLAAGPFTLKALIDRVELAGHDPRKLRLRHCVISGDVVPDAVYRRFRDLFGFAVCELFGTTELMSCAMTPVDGSAEKGKFVPYGDVRFRIIDDDWAPLLPGQVGELAFHSEVAMLGYLGEPGAMAAASRDGWQRTGDLGSIDEDGHLRFVGRRKHIICYDGDKIGPQEVESALLEHPRVVEACVVGIPSQVDGEVPAAYVVIRGGGPGPIGYEELAAFLADRIASYKIPVAMHFMDALPRNVNRKIDRRSLIARATEVFADTIAAEQASHLSFG